MNPLLPLLHQLESHISNFEKTNPNVSNSTVGWQIDHSLRVMNQVIAALIRSNPDEYKPKFNWRKFLKLIFKSTPQLCFFATNYTNSH